MPYDYKCFSFFFFFFFHSLSLLLDDDIDDVHKEIAALAACQCDAITDYCASVLPPGSSELLIVMELLDASAADLVCVLFASSVCLCL